jgi:hypothetical protein
MTGGPTVTTPPADVDAGLQIQAGLTLALGKMNASLARAEQYSARMQQAVMYLPILAQVQAVASGAVLFASKEHDLGPPDGYVWAVQRLTVAGLTGTDVCSIYKGPPLAQSIDPSRLANLVTATAPTWNPGRTGMVLYPGDSILVSGSALAAASVAVSGEVIQLEKWIVPQFLL